MKIKELEWLFGESLSINKIFAVALSVIIMSIMQSFISLAISLLIIEISLTLQAYYDTNKD